MPKESLKSDKHEKPDTRRGHRERLRARFIKGGGDALHEYELLELILFRAIPRRDVKPIAKELLDKFKDLSAVLSASRQDLTKTNFITDSVVTEFKIIEASALRLGQSKIMHREILGNWDAIIAYCRTKLAENKVEELHVLFLDKKNRIIADEAMAIGTVDHTPFYPREIIKRALELNASGLILVHNHPSGDPQPSKADIKSTIKLRELAQGFNIFLHDHIIIGRHSEVSFKNDRII
ncbi:MAG: DNA repair protein RadC [Alphaproteobacteria bacterium]|nr:DNA repair protein RadC [Alphaproteobacteria bacterium]MBE8220249.1 DNA repair protein RadC [Alphaproteobacteria bacterium]